MTPRWYTLHIRAYELARPQNRTVYMGLGSEIDDCVDTMLAKDLDDERLVADVPFHKGMSGGV